MERIVLARHGESEYSVRGAANGDPLVAVALTEVGREQARRLGDLLADEPLDLCATSEFGRARETADIALAGRDVPRLVLPALNDIRLGDYEGCQLDDYRTWARGNGPEVEPPGGGESRVACVLRYLGAFETLRARPERTILVVAHGLPVRYLLNANEGLGPVPFLEQVPYAEPFPVTAAEFDAAVDLLERWTLAPAWAD
jgi:2,3-bisphosphoglycerate-dependent phosphoglycerate mutase